MKTKKHLLTLIGFITLISGIILATIGFLSNGFDELSKLSVPVHKEASFDNITSLELSLFNYYIETEESPDNKIHVSYQYFEDDKTNQILVKEEKGKLRIIQTDYYGSVVQLPISAISRELSEQKNQTYILKLSLPKNMTLEELSGAGVLGEPLHLSDIHIKNINYSDFIYGENVQIDGGTIFRGDFINSQLKNVNVQNYSSMTLTNSTLENATVSYNSWFKVEKSHIKNTTITGEYADFVATDLTLENSDLTFEQAEVDIKNLTLKGKNTITNGDQDHYGRESHMTISLSDKSRDSSNLNLEITRPFTINTKDIKDLTINDNKASRTVKDSKDSLTIINNLGNISLD